MLLHRTFIALSALVVGLSLATAAPTSAEVPDAMAAPTSAGAPDAMAARAAAAGTSSAEAEHVLSL